MKTIWLNAGDLGQLTYIYDSKATAAAAAAVLAAATQQMDLTNSNIVATNNNHVILGSISQQSQQSQQQQLHHQHHHPSQQQHLELPTTTAHLMSLQTYLNKQPKQSVSNLNVNNAANHFNQLPTTQPAQISPTALLPLHQLQLKQQQQQQQHRQQLSEASSTNNKNLGTVAVHEQNNHVIQEQQHHILQQQQQQHHHHHQQQRNHPHQHHPYFNTGNNVVAAHQQQSTSNSSPLLHIINSSNSLNSRIQNQHPNLVQQQQQQPQQQQQQFSHARLIKSNATININGTNPTNYVLTNRIKQQQQLQQQQQQQQQHQHPKHNIPVHALNQNSNFSAASSSTGGGTISSHAPTQQSNTTGSSLSPPAAVTVNPRTTTTSSSHVHHIYVNNHSNINNNNKPSTITSNPSNVVISSTPTPPVTPTPTPTSTPTPTPIPISTSTPLPTSTNNNSTSAVIRSTGIAIPTAPLTTTTQSTVNGISPASIKKIKTEPVLSQFYQNERLSFASGHLTWLVKNWKRLILQDERKFNLDGPDGYSSYYHDLRNQERILSQRPRGISVFVYILVTSGGPLHIEVGTSKLNSASVIDITVRQRENIITKLGGITELFLQDLNWSIGALPNTQERLNAEGVKIQKWPVVAHDINIIENIWGWLIREVYDGGRKFSRKDDLIFRIREAFTRMPMDLITNLYTTLPERIRELVQTNAILLLYSYPSTLLPDEYGSKNGQRNCYHTFNAERRYTKQKSVPTKNRYNCKKNGCDFGF